jgi:hypothetical protein
MLVFFLAWIFSFHAFSATIAIIDTGFDLDSEFLRPKLTQEASAPPEGWNFQDNSHLKKPVIEDQSVLQEVLLFRSLKAKGHKEGLTMAEFEWFKNKSANKEFMENVRLFKKHAHGTLVAGIALREGENINIFPIRGLHIPTPVVAVEDSSPQTPQTVVAKTPEEKFQEEIKNSLNRVTKKFSKICRYIGQNKIEIVNASYGISYKNITAKFREKYKEITGKDIEEKKLEDIVDKYFKELYARGEKTIRRYPKMLFVFSAGNSGLDTDKFHHYPSRMKLPNTISVAAMNGDYLASFSNYGMNVDIGAPGVAVLSLVPHVYAEKGTELYSPSSGTSMAAPHISNLAAQILNINSKLRPEEIKRIILETGDDKLHLKPRLYSGAIVNNEKALKAALLTKDMKLDEALNLAKSNLIPMEDQISFGSSHVVAPEVLKEKVLNTLPSTLVTEEDEEPSADELSTKPESSSPKDLKTEQPDSSSPPVSAPQADRPKSADQVPASQTSEQSPPPSGETPASSSQSESPLPSSQSPESVPSSPQ